MADEFDQKFGDFIVTNFHEEQKVMKYDQSQIFLKSCEDIFLKYND